MGGEDLRQRRARLLDNHGALPSGEVIARFR
jgi:hypothetical protein